MMACRRVRCGSSVYVQKKSSCPGWVFDSLFPTVSLEVSEVEGMNAFSVDAVFVMVEIMFCECQRQFKDSRRLFRTQGVTNFHRDAIGGFFPKSRLELSSSSAFCSLSADKPYGALVRSTNPSLPPLDALPYFVHWLTYDS